MKTKLLSITLMMVLVTSITKAQTKIWDFANDATTWPLSAGIGNNPMVVDNLGLYPIATNTNFGAVTNGSGTFTDGFTGPRRFQMNGAGYPTGPFQAMPTQRYLFIDVSGPCTVKVWFKSGSGGAARTVYVSDGTAAVGSATSNTGGNADDAIVTASYTGAAGRLYIYGDTACNLYKVSVVGATVNTVLSNNDFQTTSLVKAFTNGRQIYLSNVVSKTQVEVYSVTGALVNSINTEADTSFEVMTAGVYILKIKSEEGQKSVKLVVQ